MAILQHSPENHQRYMEWCKRLEDEGDHPDPDQTRVWINIRKAIGEELWHKARHWVKNVKYWDRPGAWTDSTTNATDERGSVWSISEPVLMALGRALEPAVSAALGTPAYISYSGLSVMYHGIPVKPHRDVNKGSRYLLSWPIDLDVDEWPIYIEGKNKEGQSYVDRINNADPDRGLLFAGHDVWHWRDGYPGGVGKSFYLRYTINNDVRMHSKKDTDILAAAGRAELNGEKPLLPDGIIVPHCNRISEPQGRDYVIVKSMFKPSEVDMILYAQKNAPFIDPSDWPETARTKGNKWFYEDVGGSDAAWIRARLQKHMTAAAPLIEPNCLHNSRYINEDRGFQIATYWEGDSFPFHYDWSDTRHDRAARRTVSVVVPLRKADVGGTFVIEGSDFTDRSLEPGDAVIFSAKRVNHSVTTVLKGHRVALSARYGISPEACQDEDMLRVALDDKTG